jgi:hypothetical protein
MFPSVKRLLLLACAALLVLPAAGQAASVPPATPKVKSVSPLKLAVGERLTIRGSGFIAGKRKTTVVFKRDGRRAVFAKSESGTRTKLVVRVPSQLLSFLGTKNGLPTATRFRVRVLARRFAESYTPLKRSPVILPTTAPGSGSAASPDDCDKDGQANAVDADDDNDQLPDTLEAQIGTDPCKADTDGDGVSDAFEYESALDLNSRAVPYPGKRPYPNPLDGADANVDFDQDGLPQIVEYLLWQHSGGRLPLTYSDGQQDTGGRTATPANPDLARLDLDHDGRLTDDEKDEDHDLLGNWVEYAGPMRTAWWAAMYSSEAQYVGAAGASLLYETSFLDADSDGDGVIDGLDDQDHDGYSNRDELIRGPLWMHVYNPCLPNPYSRVCTLHPPISGAWAPFQTTLPPRPAPDDPPVELPWP